MARRKKGRAVNGWLVLDKPAGMTSTQAVGAVRRLFDARKAGHAGTLDPLATGILPIALGEATKTVPYAVEGEKGYRFTVRWGVETDTDDAEGRSVATSDVRPERGAIEAVLPQFTGEILQMPPAFSAIKIDGDRAYDLARAGETVELEARPVRIDLLDLVEMPDRRHGRVRGRAAARAPMCVRWRGTWAARSAASATSSRCGARGSQPSPRPMRSPWRRCEAARGRARSWSDCCCRSRPPSASLAALASARTTRPGCCAARPC